MINLLWQIRFRKTILKAYLCVFLVTGEAATKYGDWSDLILFGYDLLLQKGQGTIVLC